MNIDLYILAFSAVTVAATIWMGFRSAKKSKTASDFFVAGRSVGVGMNASAISGEYLSAASFMGIAGMVMSSGYDALWYPVCYACGYLFLLLFIAGPLRRFGAYTIPDFAEGRFDSPLFRKIAVVFVLFIGFFYTMPQMKGAGTTLAYIFPGLPYWAGVVLVGAVITLNVALGGMKGITLVQAFQYWAKMFAISVPIFVLMAVYGHYGKQVGVNGVSQNQKQWKAVNDQGIIAIVEERDRSGKLVLSNFAVTRSGEVTLVEEPIEQARKPLPAKAPADSTWLNPFGPLTTKAAKNAAAAIGKRAETKSTREAVTSISWTQVTPADFSPPDKSWLKPVVKVLPVTTSWSPVPTNLISIRDLASRCAAISHQPYFISADLSNATVAFGYSTTLTNEQYVAAVHDVFTNHGAIFHLKDGRGEHVISSGASVYSTNPIVILRDGGDVRLVSKAVWAAKLRATEPHDETIPLRADLSSEQHLSLVLDSPTVAEALGVYSELTGRQLVPQTNRVMERVDDWLNGRLSKLKLIARTAAPDNGLRFHNDGAFTVGEVKGTIEAQLRTNGLALVPVGDKSFRLVAAEVTSLLTSAATAEKAWLDKHEKPLALLYTYSLIIAIVCGTAGLPHILVRFYTNPDGTAAKKTTMWVMILIGVFYVFPPVFGVIGRNLLPELYAGVGAKGTDKIVLELPRILNEKYAPLGSILSGIACAGAFAAFMSTFSGLLVSMTGALAHDVYGRILRPKATADERMRMFKIGAVIIGAVAILLGMQVEQLQINFMVGQAFAIAAASYFPLLFMAVWWRKLTMRGAATGMLTGGLLALTGISLTSFSDLKWINLTDFWALHPLLRILCEQPAIWAVPLAITLMVAVSKLTAREVPGDIRMKMLVLHAPEQLGLKQEYIQEHQAH